MSTLIDRVLLLVLMVIIAAFFAHLISIIVAGVLAAGLTPVADALTVALRTLNGEA